MWTSRVNLLWSFVEAITNIIVTNRHFILLIIEKESGFLSKENLEWYIPNQICNYKSLTWSLLLIPYHCDYCYKKTVISGDAKRCEILAKTEQKEEVS